MSREWNAHIYLYNDAEFLRDAITSLPNDITIYVLDGRYELFEQTNGCDWTPEAAEYCRRHPQVEYHNPRDHYPWGNHLPNPPEHRPGNHAKARYMYRHVLPDDEWTLKLDADETLASFDLDFGEYRECDRLAPQITGYEARDLHVTRICKPGYWTPWINDCLLPRALFPRDTTPLSVRARFYTVDEFRAMRFLRLSTTRRVVIENRQGERGDAWHASRVAHLESIGRGDRARELRES